ncbi:hypothetical protein [Streptomyces verrucosisporus]|uniref:hypothetical protein n=1 Tax=Streptomyces verrucosisporus TaxID=1695161 RepID=UPI0027DA0AAE|nr:hypothetical protein [Streptomyces verrucosisporus]
MKQPFAGSPARRWAEGADAIEMPKATAVGGVPAAEIRAALERTKKFLVAANLDRDVLYGPRWEHTEGMLWLYSYDGDIANDTCDEHDGFIHPQFVADRYANPATGEERDPYDRSRPVEEWAGEGECMAASRT